MQIPKIIVLNINCTGDSVLAPVKLLIKYLIAKYSKIPANREFAISKIPFEVVVPNILLKDLSLKILESKNIKLSNSLYRLLSIETNKLSKIVFIVFITLFAISSLEFN